MVNASAKFEYDKMKKQHLFLYILFSAILYTQQSKDDVIDVIVTSLWIWLLLFLRDFISENCHVWWQLDNK